MEIVVATESHVPNIIELWKEFMDFHKDIDPRFPLRNDASARMERHLRDLMASPDNLILVASDHGSVIGYAIAAIRQAPALWQNPVYGEISDMAVAARYRRHGTGAQMLGRTMEWFALRDVARIELTVASLNRVGYPFWRKHGFRDYMHRLYLNPNDLVL